jgi:DNA-binding response OmpR family regulator/DNA-binding CsgD family transcriptional regulator
MAAEPRFEPAPADPPAAAIPDRALAERVLIVDDQPDNLSLLHDALDDAGYTVLVAADGPSAIERARQAHPDIVLLDARMPGMDGFEVARRLKADADTAAIPVVFMTALTETESVVAAYEAGAIDYVAKPIQPREVLARIGAHTRSARLQRQARNALDAFGHATLVVRSTDGRLVWQTARARSLLREHFGCEGSAAPVPLVDWVRREAARAAGETRQPMLSARHGCRLTLELHPMTDDEAGDDEWLIVGSESDDAAAIESLVRSLRLTPREAEVMLWVTRGKTNRDIGEILGASPRTVTKHMEHILAKLGVETRTAAAGLALARIATRPAGG